jgi:hypothetical protein
MVSRERSISRSEHMDVDSALFSGKEVEAIGTYLYNGWH